MTNGYPVYVVNNMLKKFEGEGNEKDQEEEKSEEETTDEKPEEMKRFLIKVPFQGKKGDTIIESLKNTLKRTLPENAECRVVQTGTKLSSHFNIKDKIDERHRSNFVYQHECQNRKCEDDYIGETKRRRENRTGEHGGRDKNSEIFKHSCSTKHPKAKDKNFKILATNYETRRKRKLAEAMFIRDLKPSLNIQKDSYKLILF